jgi:hypothetical protein
MKIPSSMPRLKGFRFASEIIVYAVWVYHRFSLSTADVDDLLADRGQGLLTQGFGSRENSEYLLILFSTLASLKPHDPTVTLGPAIRRRRTGHCDQCTKTGAA